MTVTTQASPSADRSATAVEPELDGGTGRLSERAVGRLALGVTLVPFVVGALALLFAVGGQYHPWSDHALIELQTRSVGHDEVLVGLYSRGTWKHPGPALFYVLAPFYWVTGGMSVSISIGALAVNGASVAGMALVARRLGGLRLMLITLLANALLMRALGGEFLQDPWNCFVTTLPFGLLVFLTWAMWRGELWAFPVGAGVFTFLAQTHVGFVALASPLLAWGVVGLVASVLASRRAAQDPPGAEPGDGDRPLAWRPLVRSGVIGAVVLLVGWAPVLYDTLRNTPSNLGQVIDYFRHPDEPAHTLVEGWRVMAGQFGGSPEWLIAKHPPGFVGQSPFVYSSPFPWMLLLLVAAGIVLWRRRVAGGPALVGTLALTFVMGVVAVSRTIGPAFDYRLRWTLIPGMIGLVVIGWAGWTLAEARWPRTGARILPPAALAGLTLLGGINVYTAATAGTPQSGDSVSTGAISDQVIDHLSGFDGIVVVNDQSSSGAWHARGLLLQLEREGFDVGVTELRVHEYGRHRVVDPAALSRGRGNGLSDDEDADREVVVLHVSRDEFIANVATRPGMRMIAEWHSTTAAETEALSAERTALDADVSAGRISQQEAIERGQELIAELTGDGKGTAYHVAVFAEEPAVAAPSAPTQPG